MNQVLSLLLIFIVIPSVAWSSNPSTELDTLGVNKELLKRARKMNPKQSVKVVQKRAVDRSWRVEGALGYGLIAGGNPYLDSTILDGQVDLHITPRWSLGARYFRFDNDLSSEGERVFNPASQQSVVPDVSDFPTQAAMGTITWYPIYGKINLFNWNVTQFDIYLVAGYGQIELQRSGSASLWTAGGGVGFWLTNWLTTRFEVRHQNYSDLVGGDRERSLDQTVFSAKIGFLL